MGPPKCLTNPPELLWSRLSDAAALMLLYLLLSLFFYNLPSIYLFALWIMFNIAAIKDAPLQKTIF